MLDITHFEQMISCFKESNHILSYISDFDTSYYIINPDGLNPNDLGHYYYDTSHGFYSCIREKSDEVIYVYGKTKHDIIFKLVDDCIKNEAYYEYAPTKYKKLCQEKGVDHLTNLTYTDYYFNYAKQRIDHCHNIVDRYIEEYKEMKNEVF